MDFFEILSLCRRQAEREAGRESRGPAADLPPSGFPFARFSKKETVVQSLIPSAR